MGPLELSRHGDPRSYLALRQRHQDSCSSSWWQDHGLNLCYPLSISNTLYLSMSSWFNRDDQALHGFSGYFKKASDEEREHGVKLMKYQADRGGKCVFQDIAKPSTMEWGTPLQAVEAALELEKSVNQSLLSLHGAASDKVDPHLCDFIESEYLDEQVKGIKELGDLVTKLKRAGDGLGVHIIDK